MNIKEGTSQENSSIISQKNCQSSENKFKSTNIHLESLDNEESEYPHGYYKVEYYHHNGNGSEDDQENIEDEDDLQ